MILWSSAYSLVEIQREAWEPVASEIEQFSLPCQIFWGFSRELAGTLHAEMPGVFQVAIELDYAVVLCTCVTVPVGGPSVFANIKHLSLGRVST